MVTFWSELGIGVLGNWFGAFFQDQTEDIDNPSLRNHGMAYFDCQPSTCKCTARRGIDSTFGWRPILYFRCDILCIKRQDSPFPWYLAFVCNGEKFLSLSDHALCPMKAQRLLDYLRGTTHRPLLFLQAIPGYSYGIPSLAITC